MRPPGGARRGQQLATIDALVQDVHFRLALTSWEDLGWKSLAVNLSDIAAMGGRADYALVSLALPGETDVRDIVMFYQGMLALAREFDVAVVGGNIARAPLVVINIAIFGSGDGLLRRSAAREGDQVAVTGYLGASAAGLEVLTRGTALPARTAGELRGVPAALSPPQGRPGAGGVRRAGRHRYQRRPHCRPRSHL